MIRLFAFISLVWFSSIGLSSDFFKLEKNNQYENEKLTFDYMPFHSNKTQIYLNKNGQEFWTYKYGNSVRDRYVNFKNENFKANKTEKYGTMNNKFVLYDPEMTHKMETYWTIDAKIGDKWQGNILYFDVNATLTEFGDVVINGQKTKYAKINLYDLKRNMEGYVIFAKDIGMIEFKLAYQYLRLK